MSFRGFVDQLDREGMLTRINKEVSTEYEIASIIAAMKEKPVFFEKVKEFEMPVVGGLVSSIDLIAKALEFPVDWTIEQIKSRNNVYGESEMIISGSDFPEVNNACDVENVDIIIHQKAKTFEVKKR